MIAECIILKIRLNKSNQPKLNEEVEMTDQYLDQIRIAFVDIVFLDDKIIRGAALVTDMKTQPFEFRVTSPVKPTALQEMLYGTTLKEYVYADLICLPLVKQIREKISLVIVRDPNLLKARPNLGVPMAYLEMEKQALKKIHVHPKFPGEIGSAEELIKALTQDKMEPFERIKVAVIEVHKYKKD